MSNYNQLSNERLAELRADLLDLEVRADELDILTEDDERAVAGARNLANKVKAAQTWEHKS